MSEDVKSDMAILRAAQKERDCAFVYDAIKRDEYRRLVERCVKEVTIEGVEEKDKDLYL